MTVKTKIFFCCLAFLPMISCNVFKPKKTAQSEVNLPENKRLEFDKYFLDANKEKILGNSDDAIRLLKKCITIWPQNAAANYELAMYSFKKNDFANAISQAKIAFEADPSNGYYAQLYAELLKINKQYDKSSKVYERLVTANPERTDWYLNWVNLLLLKPDYNKALKVLDNLELQMGVSEEIVLKKEQIYLRQNKFSSAKNEVEKLIKSDPNNARYYTILGDLYKANNKNDEALAAYKKSLEINPNEISTHFELADYYRDSGEKQKYFDELHILFSNPEIDIDTKINWLITFYGVDEKDKDAQLNIKQLVEAVLTAHPKEAKTHAVKGDFLFRDKQYSEARESYLKAIELDKSKYLIWNQLLVIDSQINDWVKMAEDAEKTIELFPNEPAPYLLFGMAKLQQKNPKEAIQKLTKGFEYVLDNKALKSQFLANLGDAYYQEKNNPKSDSCYDRALDINPNDVYILNNYSYYLSLRNDKLDKAENMSRKSNELEPDNASYLDTYAWILYAQKKYSDAKIYMEKALAVDGNKNPVLLEHYGDILYKLDMKENAFEYWQKAKTAGKGSDFLEQKIVEKKLIE